jgi:hypothetical protein
VALLQVQRLGELPRVHRGDAEIPDLPGLDDIVQRLKCLDDRSARIAAVDLVQVDVVGAEARKAVLELEFDAVQVRCRARGDSRRRVRYPGRVRLRGHPEGETFF